MANSGREFIVLCTCFRLSTYVMVLMIYFRYMAVYTLEKKNGLIIYFW